MPEYKPCRIIIDNTSRFDDKVWINLPFDENKWNRFDAEIIDDVLYYKNKKVLELNKIEHCNNGIHKQKKEDISNNNHIIFNGEKSKYDNLEYKYISYYCYFYSGPIINDDKNDYSLGNTTLYFDDNPITDVHIQFEIII
tara:strand:+ start:637 stop:1056 length:420 start_codon:yes stop_codon:yes gene_type:complete